MFYRKGLELGLSPNDVDKITLEQWQRLAGANDEEDNGYELTADMSDEELRKTFGL